MEIARALGCWPEVSELENRLERGELTTPEFITRIHELWAGDLTSDLTPQVVAQARESAPWIHGLRQVLADIDAHGDFALVITMTPDLFAGHLRNLGAHRVIAQPVGPLPLRPGGLHPSQVLTPRHKTMHARAVFAELAADKPDLEIVAFGDGMSDVELFAELPGIPRHSHDAHRVAVNASEQLRGEPTCTTTDLISGTPTS